MKDHWGRYLLIVDGSIPTGNPGYSTIAGHDNLSMLREAPTVPRRSSRSQLRAFGGIPGARRIRPAPCR